MKITQNPKIGSIQRIMDIIRHGLLLFGIRNRLASIGFDINPYYWVQEEFTECQEPEIKGNKLEFTLIHLDSNKLKDICVQNDFMDKKKMINDLNSGQQCIGLQHDNEIAAFMFIDFNDFVFSDRLFHLKENEAYILNVWTLHSYRSKNLASYLRYLSYQLLRSQGKNVKYSIIQCFNKSSIKVINKLNSKYLRMYLSIVFFKKYYWNFIIWEFK